MEGTKRFKQFIRAGKKLGFKQFVARVGRFAEEDLTLEDMAGVCWDEKVDFRLEFMGLSMPIEDREEPIDVEIQPKKGVK